MGVKLSCTYVDDYGRTTHRTYGMEAQTLLADYIAAAGGFLTAMEAVTDLGLVRAEFHIPLASPEWAAISGANVDVGATASGWISLGGGKKASMKVPGIKDALVGADGSVAISGAMATLLAEFEDAADFNLSDGEQIESWIRAALDR